ncbi:MAG: precorrin-6y C5,15-methyltransferase (decarboxylating) subunit CbiE [Candidatus Contendobacter sp.]|jgi:precorrin-6Y C5,15-methyltransferase (decarboxylating)|nr:precorrin-6y C5,15-methyltransferase (decarboxylating) subunit CbiE [Gammaproteobacteria bacterium]MCC8993681.1 precorrin-6y C5,15-methyltransferase (decarboxylating) subunit CbiE [Candidatus Contendobacter sp.]
MSAMLDWSGLPIQVIGMGMAPGTLGQEARAALEEAELIIGSTPHLAAFPELAAEKMPYPSPMSGLPALLQAHAGRRIAVLASGDPLFYGISQNLLRFLPPEHLVFHANISSLQAAFARLGRPWQAAQLLSLHGRPLAGLRAVLQANRLYALLTDRDNSPIAIARIVAEAGFGKSDLWVSEELGTAEERFRHFQTAELADADIEFSPLNVVILETRGPGGVLPEFPGIADERFSTGEEPGKGLLSKREVRLTILSLLAPRAGEIGWDVGAGCGGVSVEWARWNPLGAVYAVECHPERLAHLGINRDRFGVIANLQIIPGIAPAALAALPDPQAAFIGGSSGNLRELLETVWARLQPGGRLVASAITEDSRVELHQFASDREAYWTELSVARAERLAGQRIMRPYLPALLMKLEKST